MPTPTPEPSRADDIASLKERLQLPEFHYVDMAERVKLRTIEQRWPVLRQLRRATAAQETSR